MSFISFKEEFNFENFTAIIPAVSVGNVAQLSIDLIINYCKLKKIGTGWHSALIPIFGQAAFDHETSNTTSFEIYGSADKEIIVFQFRSPLVAQYLQDFHQKIAAFLIEKKISKVFILAGSHAYENSSVEGSPFGYLCNDQFKRNNADNLAEQPWRLFDGATLHGGGNAQKLLSTCTLANLPALILFKYVTEGDNSQDAFQLVKELSRICVFLTHLSYGTLILPKSWRLLFGNEPPELIF